MTNLLRLPPSTSMPVYTGAAPASQRCDTARVLEWMRTPNRKAAQFAFTEGPERQAAYWIEIAQSEQAAQSDELLESACSAAAAEGNRRGVKSTDALAIVAAFRNAGAAPAAQPDARKVIEQMVVALEIAERHLAYVEITEAREAGQQRLEENK